MPVPPTRILSWLQMCQQADPNFRQLSLRPWVYEFSNGRLFVQTLPVYGQPGFTDDVGTLIRDDFGNIIQGDTQTGTSTSTGFIFGTSGFGTDPF